MLSNLELINTRNCHTNLMAQFDRTVPFHMTLMQMAQSARALRNG